MSTIMQGLGIACVIFTSSFLLVLGAWAGVKVASYLFGPINATIEDFGKVKK